MSIFSRLGWVSYAAKELEFCAETPHPEAAYDIVIHEGLGLTGPVPVVWQLAGAMESSATRHEVRMNYDCEIQRIRLVPNGIA